MKRPIQETMNEIKLGGKVRSKVSGFTGTVTGITKYLYGSTNILVSAPNILEGEPKEYWIHEQELQILE